MEILGIDIGGSGIKGAIVNSETGELVSKRHRIPTPESATPESIAKIIRELVNHFNWKLAVGCTFPSIVREGKCYSASNISKEWIGIQIDKLFSKHCGGLPFYIANDADLAGFAEITLGAGKGKKGTVIMITIGTGIGSGVYYNGELIPNVELGQLLYADGKPIEHFAADSARKREDLKLSKWAKRLDFFLNHAKLILSPDYFILGGGISKKFDKFKDELTVDVPIEVAHFKNNAGIIGAAMFAHQNVR